MKSLTVPKVLYLAISLVLTLLTGGTAAEVTSQIGKPVHLIHNAENPKIQIAILLDTSGSMEGLIEQAKTQIWQIINQFSRAKQAGRSPDLQIAVYEYGNDGIPAISHWVRKITGFTTDLDMVSEKLFSLRTNGGTEYCGAAIEKAVAELEWSTKRTDLKMIYICGNEPFSQGGPDYRQSCKLAIGNDIIVNTIYCGNEQTGIAEFWKDGADRGEGKYLSINSNQTAMTPSTPYDLKITELNTQLNSTYVYFGNHGHVRKQKQELQDKNAAALGAPAMAERTVAKSSMHYKNDDWDLVDAAKSESFELKAVEEKDLPEELRGKTLAEKEAYVKAKAEQREQIQKQITELQELRTEFIKEKTRSSGSDNSLGSAIIANTKLLAAKKNFIFE